MPLFESKETRLARERVAIQMGRSSVKEYIGNCQTVSQKYTKMAREALRLGQRNQAEHYLATKRLYQNQTNRWEAFVLKIDDIVLRGKAMNAMGGLMEGISHLCKNISKGISLRDMQSTMMQLHEGMFKVDQAEQQLGAMLGGLSLSVGPESAEANYEELPEEIKAEVGAECDALMDEIKVEESFGTKSPITSRLRSADHSMDGQTQNRIEAQMKRLEKLRKNKTDH